MHEKTLHIVLFAGVFGFAAAALAQDLVVTASQTLSAGTYAYDNVSVSNGATRTLLGDDSTGVGVTLVVAGDVTVEAGAQIDASGEGY